jgi:hypothetical protein
MKGLNLNNQIVSQVPYPGQGTSAMGTRVWNENLAAFRTSEPLRVTPPTIDAPVATPREGDAW